MFNLISKKDREFIDKYVTIYASQDPEHILNINHLAPFEERFAEWCKQKSEFLFPQIFKDKLIYEKEIELNNPVNDQIRKAKLSEHFFLIKLRTCLYKTQEKPIDYKFVTCIDNLISEEAFAENTYKYINFTVPLPQGTNMTVRNSSKVMKTLGKLASSFGLKEEYEDFRLKHSLALNEKKITGTLCISIHPIDYLTLSDSDYNWRSCYSIKNWGGFRAATVETMNSPHVVVAYLKGASASKDPYNKKWRELFIVSPHLITGIKGYPYHSSLLEETALNFITEIAETNNYLYQAETYHFSKNKLEHTFTFEFNNTYDEDFHYIPARPHLCKFKDNPEDTPKSWITVGGIDTCLYCGKPYKLYEIYDGSSYEELTSCLLCPDCENVIKCNNCGDYLLDKKDNYSDINGEFICSSCSVREKYNNVQRMRKIYF